MRYKKLKALIFILLLGVCLAFFPGLQKAGAAARPYENNSDFKVNISCGLDGYSRYESNIPVTLEITNKGADFSGKVCLIQDMQDSQNQRIAYSQNILAAAKETLTLEFVMPVIGIAPIFDITITDDAGQEHYNQRVRTSIQYTDDIYIGILTDDFNSMRYIDGMPFFVDMYSSYISTRIFELNETNFSKNSSVLKSYDAIIINNFDTSALSMEQYDALKTWVDEGGTLLIGTGVNYNKTLSLFKNDYLTGSFGSVFTQASDFGLNGYSAVTRSFPIEYELPQIIEENPAKITEDAIDENDSLDGEDVETYVSSSSSEDENIFITQILSGIDKIRLDTVHLQFDDSEQYSQFLCQKIKKGSGKILVFSFDLGLEPFCSWEYNMQALQNILSSLTTVTQYGNMRGFFSMDDYYARDMLSNYIAGNLPEIGRFIIIIVVYIILISPAAYIIFKKKDKRQWLWVTVPVLACLFTGILFLVGYSSRQKDPYLNYSTILTSNTGGFLERTYVGVTSPKNKGFEFVVEDGYTIAPIANDYSSSFFYKGDENNDYDINLTFNKDQTIIDVQNINAFGSKYFGAQKKIKAHEKVETDIYYIKNHYEGTVTNHMGYTLENAFLKLDNWIVYIGMLADGASCEIDSRQGIPITSTLDIPDVVFNEPSSRYKMLSGYVYNMRSNYYSPYSIVPNYALVAFVPDYPVDVASASGYENSGNVMLWDTVNVNYEKDGIFTMPNLLYTSTLLSGDMDGCDYYFYSDEIKFECNIPSQLKEISGAELVYEGNENMSYYLYHWEKDMYDEVFKDGQKQLNASQLEPYMKDGCLRIKFEKEIKDTYSSAAFPVISLTGRGY